MVPLPAANRPEPFHPAEQAEIEIRAPAEMREFAPVGTVRITLSRQPVHQHRTGATTRRLRW